MTGSSVIGVLASVQSITLLGIEAIPLTVECDIATGLPAFHTVGLPDAAIRESAHRVRAALRNAGFTLPPRRITVSLAPADLRKQGSALDLAIALGILAASGVVPRQRLCGMMVIGELALDGTVRRVRGGLSAALVAHRRGVEGLIVPDGNRVECLAIPGPAIYGVASLADAIAALRGERTPQRSSIPTFDPEQAIAHGDLAEIRGQLHARRALEVAAAGGHHLLLVGPPGCGKTMLARRLPGILPALDLDESIEVSSIYSAAGLSRGNGLMRYRPFRAPHHTISGVGLVGGGHGPRPGEVTLAHRGVLFLDELPEFGRATLDVLRQPVEEGCVSIGRASGTTRLPARFALIGAMNRCPCGRLGRSDRPCGCSPPLIANYQSRLSGPLLDRFDLQVELEPVPLADLRRDESGEPSCAVARRVLAARLRQSNRSADGRVRTNAALRETQLRRFAPLDAAGNRILGLAMQRLGLTARAHDAVLRVARTIADLEGRETIDSNHVAEAVQYRAMDRASGIV